MASYPKWLYHHSKPALVVADEAEHKALGAGWAENPSEAQASASEPETKKPDSVDDVREFRDHFDEPEAAQAERDLRRASGQEAADERAALIVSQRKSKTKRK